MQAPGDFAGTLLFDVSVPRERLGQISFVAGLAVAQAVGEIAPKSMPMLKWPNDVLAGGGKLAGLLLELLDWREERATLALGVGVNVVSKPAMAEYPAARLLDFLDGAPAPTPAELAPLIDAAFERWRSAWSEHGFAPVRTAWLEKAARFGERIRVRLPDSEVSGVFKDLDPTGALVLDCEGETRRISAGAILSGPGA